MKPPALVAEPSGLVTTTSWAPTVPSGVVAAIWVSSVILKAATVPPMVTSVAVAKLVPVMVILVPPPVGPDEGETVSMVGAAA